MAGFHKIMLITGLLCCGQASLSQDLYDGPEGVVFDSAGNRYLVANATSGTIVQVDQYGQQSIFMDSLTIPLGLHIVGNILYVSTNHPFTLKGIDLASAQIVMDLTINHWSGLNGLTSDNSGNLYLVDQGGRIYVVWPDIEDYSVLIASGLPSGPQGILFDEDNNRLILVSFQWNSPIVAINLVDTSVSVLTTTSIGQFTGITADPDNNIYVSSWRTHCVHKWESSFQNPPEVFSSGHESPTGVCYNAGGNMFAVSNYGSSTVDFIPLDPADIELEITPESPDRPGNYPNPFNGSTTVQYSLDSPSDVIINIYDILGREIESFTWNNQPAGDHQARWDACDEPSGVYFYTIRAGGVSRTKCMTLLK